MKSSLQNCCLSAKYAYPCKKSILDNEWQTVCSRVQSSWQGIIGSEKQLATKATVNLDIYRNNSIKPPGGGLIQNSTFKRGRLIREGALIQKEAFLRGDLFETHIMFQKKQNFHPKNCQNYKLTVR